MGIIIKYLYFLSEKFTSQRSSTSIACNSAVHCQCFSYTCTYAVSYFNSCSFLKKLLKTNILSLQLQHTSLEFLTVLMSNIHLIFPICYIYIYTSTYVSLTHSQTFVFNLTYAVSRMCVCARTKTNYLRLHSALGNCITNMSSMKTQFT